MHAGPIKVWRQTFVNQHAHNNRVHANAHNNRCTAVGRAANTHWGSACVPATWQTQLRPARSTLPFLDPPQSYFQARGPCLAHCMEQVKAHLQDWWRVGASLIQIRTHAHVFYPARIVGNEPTHK